MKYWFAFFFGVAFSSAASGQSLRNINFNYLYDPSEPAVNLRPVRYPDHWMVFYKFQLRDSSAIMDEYSIEWEGRESIGDNENILHSEVEVTKGRSTSERASGALRIPMTSAPKIVAARVSNRVTKKIWMFYTMLEPEYPVTNYLTSGGEAVLTPFVNTRDNVTLVGNSVNAVSFYRNDFPTASPPFAEAQARVNKTLRPDSVFSLTGGLETSFSVRGLYLIQSDTNATHGVAIRAEDDYPRLARIQTLAGPLVYVCTREEYDRLVLARNDKKAFDRIILNITTDTERARKFMRNYFRRVELANQYFTSYKEGWKTDRGMIYIVFGLPDEVFKFNDREVWNYKNDEFKVTFNFSKATSIFDPDNYVLIREQKYLQTWYEVIELWRNARF